MPESTPSDISTALADLVDVIAPEPWLDHLDERYGIPPTVLGEYLLYRTSGQYVSFITRDHIPTTRPAPNNLGMKLVRTHMRFPKLTTDAAMVLGRHATRNVVETDAEGARAFMNRKTFAPTDAQTAACTGTGYVIVRYDDIVLGVALYHTRSGEVESHLPKVRAREVQI